MVYKKVPADLACGEKFVATEALNHRKKKWRS